MVIELLYYSQIVSAKVGFGDISPAKWQAMVLTTIQIIYSSMMLIIWFRGVSFVIKQQYIRRFDQQTHTIQKQQLENKSFDIDYESSSIRNSRRFSFGA